MSKYDSVRIKTTVKGASRKKYFASDILRCPRRKLKEIITGIKTEERPAGILKAFVRVNSFQWTTSYGRRVRWVHALFF